MERERGVPAVRINGTVDVSFLELMKGKTTVGRGSKDLTYLRQRLEREAEGHYTSCYKQ